MSKQPEQAPAFRRGEHVTEIAGLREALDEDQRQSEKRNSVAPLLAGARKRLEEATKSKKLAAVKRAADGHAVDLAEDDGDVTEAQASVDLYQEAMQMAEKAAASAASRVTSMLRRELQRRAQVARAAHEEALRGFEEAARKRQISSEALATAEGTAANFPSENLRNLFQKEIAAACHETAKANA